MKVENPFHIKFRLQGKSFNSVHEILIFSKEISLEVHSFLIDWFHKNSFVEVKTSGSTGSPKVIQLQKKQMIHSARATGDYFNLPENTTALLCISPKYIAGKMMLVRALTLGWNLDVVEATSNPLKNSKKKYDFSAMVPMQLNNSLAEINCINKLIVGGGVVSKELWNKIQHIKTEVFATYGMTETITHIAVKRLNVISSAVEKSNLVTERSRSDIMLKKVSTTFSHQLYKTLPNIKISIDERSCLVIDAPNVSDSQIITNDIVELVSSTEFKWLGRFDSIINSGGIKLIPEQIEEKLSELFNQRFFVAGIPDAVLGEKLILVVENNFNETAVKEMMLAKIKNLQRLSKYEIPKEIYFIEKFIETETNKINRIKTLGLCKTNT